eukprot:COSAG01_NODE_17628_length_1136_cov_1.180328_2_plen_63_part_00
MTSLVLIVVNVWHMQASERQQGGEGQLLLEVLPRDEWSALLNNGDSAQCWRLLVSALGAGIS